MDFTPLSLHPVRLPARMSVNLLILVLLVFIPVRALAIPTPLVTETPDTPVGTGTPNGTSTASYTITPGSTSTPTAIASPTAISTATSAPTPVTSPTATGIGIPSSTATQVGTQTATVSPTRTPKRSLSFFTENDTDNLVLGAPNCPDQGSYRMPSVIQSLVATAREENSSGKMVLKPGAEISFRIHPVDQGDLQFTTPSEVITNERGQATILLKSISSYCNMADPKKVPVYAVWGWDKDNKPILESHVTSHILMIELRCSDNSPLRNTTPIPNSRDVPWYYENKEHRDPTMGNIIERSLSFWEKINPKNKKPMFKFRRVSSSKQSKVNFTNICDPLSVYFAVTWYYFSQTDFPINIEINLPYFDGDPRTSVPEACRSDFPAVTNRAGQNQRQDAWTIIAHEFGHAAGLDHSDDNNSCANLLMYPDPSNYAYFETQRPADPGDVSELWNIYPTGNTSSENY